MAAENETALRLEIAELQAKLGRTQGEIDGHKRASKAASQKSAGIEKSLALRKAIEGLNFHSDAMVVQATRDSIKFDPETRQLVVLGIDGQPRLNSAYKPMTVDEFYQDFATQNPYLVKGATSASGITRSKDSEISTLFGRSSDSKAANALGLSDPSRYKRLKAEAKKQGLID